jgi:hypothetical protein
MFNVCSAGWLINQCTTIYIVSDHFVTMYCTQQALAEAVAAQQRSIQLRTELAHANAMLRLQERKYSVCGALIEEVLCQ